MTYVILITSEYSPSKAMDQKNNNDDDDYIDGCCPNVIACIPNTIGDDLR